MFRLIYRKRSEYIDSDAGGGEHNDNHQWIEVQLAEIVHVPATRKWLNFNVFIFSYQIMDFKYIYASLEQVLRLNTLTN